MRCCETQERLGMLLDGELAAPDRAIVESHCAECPSCCEALAQLQELAGRIAVRRSLPVPEHLWPLIAQRLDEPTTMQPKRAVSPRSWWHRPVPVAAVIAFAVGLSWFGLSQRGNRATASSVNFCVLLDGLSFDPREAFETFVRFHGGKPATVEEARKHGQALDFEVPAKLPGGFVLDALYTLRFGDDPGVAAAYLRNGEFLAAIFHAAVKQEHFGTHKDLPCVVGDHRGHKVEVGAWKLVHVTDPTTCHCVLSRLDEASELPPILAAVAPRSVGSGGHHHHHP